MTARGNTKRIPGTSIGLPSQLLANLPPVPDVGRLDTVADWKAEVATLYRGMRRQQIDVRDATAMAYVATVGANLAKVEEEIRQRDAIEASLREHNASRGHHNALDYSQDADAAVFATSQTESDNPLISVVPE